MTGIVTFAKAHTRVAGGIIALLLLALASVTVPAFNGDGGSLMAQTTDTISRFLGRSPGERGETDLIKTKIKRGKGQPGDKLLSKAPRAVPGEPEERALGKIFDTPPEEAVQLLPGTPIGPLAIGEIDPGSFGDLGSVGGGQSGTPGFPGGVSAVIPPGSTGGPGNPNPTDPTTPTNPTNPTDPVAAVPEPGTWAMMILGFGFCAGAMRRRRKTAPGLTGVA